MSEFMAIHLSHFGCVEPSILTRLRKMHIDSSCSNLGIGINISDVSIGPSIIDPNEGCCEIAMCTFLLSHIIIPKAGDNLKKPTKKSFHVFSFDDTEEKVVVRFEVDNPSVYTVTLCQYLDPENELPIDPNIRFLCVAHPA